MSGSTNTLAKSLAETKREVEKELAQKVATIYCKLCKKSNKECTIYTQDNTGHVCTKCISDLYYVGSHENESLPNGQIIRSHRKIGANELCICGSNKKYKKCCR